LSEARKVSATLLIATQFIKQWSDRLAESVLTATSGRAGLFKTRWTAACWLDAQAFHPRSSSRDLDRYQCVIKMQLAGCETLPAFDVKTTARSPRSCQ